MSFSVKMKWNGEWIATFFLTLYLRVWSGFGKTAARYLDLIHFPQPVRPICHSPDIGNAEGGRESERQRGRDMWKGGLEFLISRDVQNIGDCTERSFKCFTHFEKPYLKHFLIP